GPVVVTNCTFDGNGADGFSPETSVVGDLEIDGGHANGNLDDGYDLRVVGTVTVTGATASGNADNGFAVDNQETVLFEDCIANDNQLGSGFSISWQDPNPLDRVSISDCTANSNGLSGGGNGIIVKYVEGLVTVIGTTTNGNSRTGVRVDATSGVVFVRNAVSSFGLEEGFKIDADVGPVTVKDCLADDNGLEGLRVNGESVDVESLTLTRNTFVNNDGAGVALFDLGGAGPFKARCNDIAGNTHGMYLDSSVTVDARQVWWSDPAGPSGQGPGAGDTVYAEPGGTILFDPWLLGTFATAGWGCPISEVNFETGTLDEWDHVVP
ncbi:MAG: right-handed parallel beta-helix repeat-containing protein, partial [Thermoanaerobaculales bacterium]|nr:right-handed parallel beta-helix repeat-containing protein [Thermoanaerobaculales bacterium]